MKIQYASDLHLEMERNLLYIRNNPIEPVGDILILAGDVCNLKDIVKHNDFWDCCSKNFKFTYWIAGNHEFYNTDIDRWQDDKGRTLQEIRDNVLLVNNHSIIRGGVKFVFSTMWTKIPDAVSWYIARAINDFRLIKYKDLPLLPSDINAIHEESFKFISEAVKGDMPTVVVTHHVPTFMNYHEKYKGDIINQAFAVELFDFIEKSNIDYWMYGHHHNNTPDFEIGKTKLITNQLGYVGHENTGFKTKIIEI